MFRKLKKHCGAVSRPLLEPRLQLLELGKSVVWALNMMDIVKERGMEIDMHRLPEMLGDVPVVPVSAAKRTGLDILRKVEGYDAGALSQPFFQALACY